MPYRYTEEQRKVMIEESKKYYRNLKESGLFEEGVPPMAHSYSWAMMAVLGGKEPANNLDRQVE